MTEEMEAQVMPGETQENSEPVQPESVEPVDAEPTAGESVATAAEEPAPDADAAQPEAAEEEAAPVDLNDGRAWYVVHSYSGYENKVKMNLEHRIESMNMQDRIFQVVVPTEDEIEIKEGHRRRMKRRVFPGYILVQMVLDDDSWYVVRNTPGVTGFVSAGSKPAPLRPDEADKIFKRMEMEAPKIKISFREGETVRIIDGPFADFVGTVDELDLDKGRVRVLVAFFGRETPVELDFLQVQKQ
jgi:transcriptional antiterminator NusG